jgi:hypothetical protein
MLGGFAIAVTAHLSTEPGIGIGQPQRFVAIVLPAVALALTVLWAWGAVGWTAANLVIGPAFFAIFGARGWKELILFPTALVGFLYHIFYKLLGLWHGTGWLVEALGLS